MIQSVHRVEILDDSGQILDIVSQYRFIQFLMKHKEQLPPAVLSTPVSAVSKRDVISVNMNEFMIDGLLKIHSHRISGMPIVDSHGKLVGSLSASDLKVNFEF